MDKAVALQFRQLNITCSSNISRKTELGERQTIEWTRESTDWRTSTNLVIYKLHDSDVRSRVKFLPSSWTARELWKKNRDINVRNILLIGSTELVKRGFLQKILPKFCKWEPHHVSFKSFLSSNQQRPIAKILSTKNSKYISDNELNIREHWEVSGEKEVIRKQANHLGS